MEIGGESTSGDITIDNELVLYTGKLSVCISKHFYDPVDQSYIVIEAYEHKTNIEQDMELHGANSSKYYFNKFHSPTQKAFTVDLNDPKSTETAIKLAVEWLEQETQ